MQHLTLRRLGPLSAAFALMWGFAACSAPSARLHAGYIQTEMSGEIGLSTGFNIEPVTLSVEDSLGLDEDSGSFFARLELDSGPVRVTGTVFRHQQSGRSRLQAAFGDILQGVEVDSEFEMLSGKVAVSFDLLDIGPVRISPGVAVNILDVEATVRQAGGVLSETIDETLPIPLLFVQAELDLDVAGIILDAGAFDADTENLSGTVIDLEGMVILRPWTHAEIFGGYRYIDLEGEGETDDANYDFDIRVNGWFVGGGLRF